MKKNVCETCAKTFTRARNHKRQVTAVYQNADVQHEKCFTKFSPKDLMEKHKLNCCACRLCGVNFPNSLELARHYCSERRKRSGGTNQQLRLLQHSLTTTDVGMICHKIDSDWRVSFSVVLRPLLPLKKECEWVCV